MFVLIATTVECEMLSNPLKCFIMFVNQDISVACYNGGEPWTLSCLARKPLQISFISMCSNFMYSHKLMTQEEKRKRSCFVATKRPRSDPYELFSLGITFKNIVELRKFQSVYLYLGHQWLQIRNCDCIIWSTSRVLILESALFTIYINNLPDITNIKT